MRLQKKIMAVTVAVSLVLGGLYSVPPADAQVAYETNGVRILTDLVPEDQNISVNSDGSRPIISTVTNVQFDLDCNVDCTWSVAPLSSDMTENVQKVRIDSMGHVTIPKGVADGTYRITADAPEGTVFNKMRTAECTLVVDAKSAAASAEDIILDKEAIEAQVPDGAITVEEDGKSMKVVGAVRDVELVTQVIPSYLLENSVSFECDSGGEVVDKTKLLYGSFTSLDTADKIKLIAKAGSDKTSSEFNVSIVEHTFTASVNCNNIPADDKEGKYSYKIRANEDLDFCIEENTDRTLPRDTISGSVEWMINYQDGNKKIADTSYECDLGTLYFTNDYRQVRLVTPMTTEREKYEAYQEALKKKDSMTLTASVSHQVKGSNKTEKWTSPVITLKFLDETNTFSQAELDFSSVLQENRDYSVKQEILDGKEVDVYYVEADGRKLDFPAMTVSNVPGVRDFEEAKEQDFHGDDLKYTIEYAFSEVASSSFGNDAAGYQNNGLARDELSAQNLLRTENRRLTKQGIGYVKVSLKTTSGSNQIGKVAEYYIRFVKNAVNPRIRHTSYEQTSSEYRGDAVIHIRQGEADLPTVFVQNEDGDMENVEVTQKNPYMEYTFETIWPEGKKEIASATIDRMTDVFRINGLENGKVKVTATSTVDKSQSDSYVMYVNDEIMEITENDGLEIDISDAMSKGVISSSEGRRCDIRGHIEGIQLDVRASGTHIGIPKVIWSSDAPEYAKITEDGKLTTLKSTGGDYVTITAASITNEDVKAELQIKIIDVPATGFKTISEDVGEGKQAVITSLGENAGTCKAYMAFCLKASDYLPQEATSADGKITWFSSNEEVATIDKDTGEVETWAEGNTVIMARYSSGSTETSTVTYNLTVSGIAEKVTGITVSPESLEFERVGLSEVLTAEVSGSASDKSVSFTSGDDSIASVTDAGAVTAKAVGTTEITVTSNADPSVKVTVPVTVKGVEETETPEVTPTPETTATVTPPPAAETPGAGDTKPSDPAPSAPSAPSGSSGGQQKITVSVEDPVIAIGGKTKVIVQNATGTAVYSSSDSTVAVVDDTGIVTGLKAGNVTITVKSGTMSATADVTVAKNPVIKLAKKTIKRKKSTKVKIKNKAPNATVKYSLKKKAKKIVKVTKAGKITGKKKGKAVITVKVIQYGKTYKKKLNIKVK